MTELASMYAEYRLGTRAYNPLIPLSDADYFTLFKSGIRRMYNDTGRASLYVSSAITDETDRLVGDLDNDEQEYIVVAAQAAYFRQMLVDCTSNRIASHKTDALTVTFSNDGPKNLAVVIAQCEARLLALLLKMSQFAEAISE